MAVTGAELVLVSNPDVVVHPGALAVLGGRLRRRPHPGHRRALDPGVRRHPLSVGPSLPLGWSTAVGHALLGTIAPGNRFTPSLPDGRPRRRRSRPPSTGSRGPASWPGAGPSTSWVASTSRISCTWRNRSVLAGPPGRLGGGLRPGRRGHPPAGALHRPAGPTACSWPITGRPSASRRGPSRGWRRLALPGVAVVLAARLLVAWARQAGCGQRAHGMCTEPKPRPTRVSGRSWPGEIQENGWRAPAPPEAARKLPRPEARQVVRQPGHDLPARRGGSSSTAATSDQHPDRRRPTGDRRPLVRRPWPFDVCGTVQPNLPTNPNLEPPIPGIHTDGDGVIQVEPTTSGRRRQQRHPRPLRGRLPQVRL